MQDRGGDGVLKVNDERSRVCVGQASIRGPCVCGSFRCEVPTSEIIATRTGSSHTKLVQVGI